MKVLGNTAYIVSEASNHGMQVVDLTSLRGKVSLTTLTADVEYREFGNAHNVIANEETGFLYVVGSNSCNGETVIGLHVVKSMLKIVDLRIISYYYQVNGCYSKLRKFM